MTGLWLFFFWFAESSGTITFTVSGAALIVTAKTIFSSWGEWKDRQSKRQQAEQQQTNKAGDKPTEYYDAKFDKLDDQGQRTIQILEKQTELMQENIKLMTELVTVSRIQAQMRAASAGHD